MNVQSMTHCEITRVHHTLHVIKLNVAGLLWLNLLNRKGIHCATIYQALRDLVTKQVADK